MFWLQMSISEEDGDYYSNSFFESSFILFLWLFLNLIFILFFPITI